ncbi:MAG: polyprenyl synthetase family protein [Candidatus Eisenbacteria bacterium]|nr:polyprenyl synthetase family protein [Candidatus Eisenbacteria bacterium]
MSRSRSPMKRGLRSKPEEAEIPAFLDRFMKQEAARIEAVLSDVLPNPRRRPSSVHRAMAYGVLGGGKRIRPILSVMAYRACGGRGREIYTVGAAMELIHSFTLIHDDLPCMDDDTLRRGKPTVHVAFGEAVALLAGDALLSLAFELLSSLGISRPSLGVRTSRMVHEVARAAGTMGVVGGQVLDIESERKIVAPGTIDYIHTHKTGALITCSVRLGALLAGAPRRRLDALSRYGSRLGFAFQIVDDIRDLKASSEELGKSRARDRVRRKATYPLVKGLEKSLAKAQALVDDAKIDVTGFGKYEAHFKALADYVVRRAVVAGR